MSFSKIVDDATPNIKLMVEKLVNNIPKRISDIKNDPRKTLTSEEISFNFYKSKRLGEGAILGVIYHLTYGASDKDLSWISTLIQYSLIKIDDENKVIILDSIENSDYRHGMGYVTDLLFDHHRDITSADKPAYCIFDKKTLPTNPPNKTTISDVSNKELNELADAYVNYIEEITPETQEIIESLIKNLNIRKFNNLIGSVNRIINNSARHLIRHTKMNENNHKKVLYLSDYKETYSIKKYFREYIIKDIHYIVEKEPYNDDTERSPSLLVIMGHRKTNQVKYVWIDAWIEFFVELVDPLRIMFNHSFAFIDESNHISTDIIKSTGLDSMEILDFSIELFWDSYMYAYCDPIMFSKLLFLYNQKKLNQSQSNGEKS